MLTAQRKQLIRDELDQRGRVVAGDLATRFGLSADTIRRDLRQMAQAGECQRVYGGAVAPFAAPLNLRHGHLADEKAQLAAKAITLIAPNQTVMIDAGSTNSAIARVLPEGQNLTVVTNAPDIAAQVAQRPDLQLVVLGGDFDRLTGALLGPQTQASLKELRADWLFLGSCGFDETAGVTSFNAAEAIVKKAMVAACDRTAVAVTGEKFGLAAPFRVMPANAVDKVLTAS